MMTKSAYPVRVVAATNGTKIIMINATDFRNKFDSRDKDKIKE
jgi:hypothetical protein|tara:strand:+ start:336 stop:464 length:129 start_codon:yes stop_codon:yes gene_type:complete